MKFNEEFPGLCSVKERQLNLSGVFVETKEQKEFAKRKFKNLINLLKRDVKKYCLDKQRVKEIIDSHWGKDSIDGNYKYLIRELGLE